MAFVFCCAKKYILTVLSSDVGVIQTIYDVHDTYMKAAGWKRRAGEGIVLDDGLNGINQVHVL